MKAFKLYILISVLTFCACADDFLEMRRESNQVIPHRIEDYQALLDNTTIMNNVPAVELGIIGSDEFYVKDGILSGLPAYQRNGYIWAKEVYERSEINDWNYAYQRILYANMAMDVIKISPTGGEYARWANVKGSALFFRTLNLYQLAQLFCKPYDPHTADKDLGVPLRFNYDVTEEVGRGTVRELYDQMVSDLKVALDLLPETPINKFRPGKAVANLLLARIYLQKGQYQQAEYHVRECLALHNELVDYNELDLEAEFTFPNDYGESNPEIMFFWRANMSIVLPSRLNVDSVLLQTYQDNDLRRDAFFKVMPDGRTVFKGSYSGVSGYFVGFASDEAWITLAECLVRLGDIPGALDALNHLLSHRYEQGNFRRLEEKDSESLLERVLLERRKQLYLRGVRWEDQRRLNKDIRLQQVWRRVIDGRNEELHPDDLRWIWPIPDGEIEVNGLRQNPR